MDEVDIRLCLLLRENSRLPYRKLADEVELSVNAVYSRVGKLREKGIIGGFQAKLSKGALKDSLRILIHGESRFEETEGVKEELSEDQNTFKMVSTSDDYFYIHGVLPGISKMSDYVEYVPKVSGIEDPKIFLPSFPRETFQEEIELKTTDYKIINTLQEDSRKSLSEVADELDVSTRTVRRRIDRMKDAGAVDYTIKWYPLYSDDFIGLIHGVIGEGNRDQKLSDIKNRYFPNAFEVEKASNHPDKVLIKTWANTLDKIQKIRGKLRSREYFTNLKNRMFYDIEYFDTWRDEVLREKAKG